MLRHILFVCLLGLVLPGMADTTAASTYRFAPESDYGPFVFLDRDGVVKGLSVDYLNLIAERGGLRIETLAAAPLSANLALARQGQADILSSLRPTPERGEFLLFTPPYVSVPAVLVVPANRSLPVGLAQMVGQKVAVGTGYAVEAYVRRQFPAVQWLGMPDDHQALRAMQRGEVSGVVADIASIRHLQARHGFAELVVGPSVGFDYPLSMAYRKDMPELGRLLEHGLGQITPSEREQIYRRWIGEAPTPDQVDLNPILYYVGGVFFLLAVILGGWHAIAVRKPSGG